MFIFLPLFLRLAIFLRSYWGEPAGLRQGHQGPRRQPRPRADGPQQRRRRGEPLRQDQVRARPARPASEQRLRRRQHDLPGRRL